MVELTLVSLIWNRACSAGCENFRAGDWALDSMLTAHGYIENGGVLHAVEDKDAADLLDAQLGYRFFGLPEVATLLAEASAAVEADKDLGLLEHEFNRRYRSLVPHDAALFEQFKAKFIEDPSQFAPL